MHLRATLDLEPSPVLGKAEHEISTPLSCPTEYISDFPCFMSRQQASNKIEAVAKAVAYLAYHSTFLVTLFSFHLLYQSCF